MKGAEVLHSSISHKNAIHRRASTADESPVGEPLILILGKDADARLLYQSFLKIWNYRTAAAGGFEDSLPLIESLRPELILMDCSVRFENSLEAVRKIRDHLFLHKIPLILISGYSQPQYREPALASGADDYLVKPVNFDDLRLRLQKRLAAPAGTGRQGENL